MHVNLPRWAFPHDLATVVEFSRMTQAALEASSRRCPASTDVIEFIGGLAVEFESRHFHTVWGEDDADFLESTEQFFDAAEKPEWFPTDEEQARRHDLAAPAQILDADAGAQAERDEAALDAAGKSIAAALREAGFACDDWGDGIVTVRDWRDGCELRLCVDVGHDPDRILVDIVSTLFTEGDFEDDDYTTLASNLPGEDLDLVVGQVRDLFRQRDGSAA